MKLIAAISYRIALLFLAINRWAIRHTHTDYPTYKPTRGKMIKQPSTSEAEINQAGKVSIAEQAQHAREHYEEAATALHCWCSIIPQAIDAWEREQTALSNRGADGVKTIIRIEASDISSVPLEEDWWRKNDRYRRILL